MCMQPHPLADERRRCACKCKSQLDAESDARLMDALFGESEAEEEVVEKDPIDESPAARLRRGRPADAARRVRRRGRVHRLHVLRAGRAEHVHDGGARRPRARDAHGIDDPMTLLEAIDCCPVNCISFVDHEDLVILESERDGLNGEDEQVIHFAQAGYRHGREMQRRAPSKAKSASSCMMCNNCPSKGCKECPMYGVGLNPIYQQRMADREEKKRQSGKLAEEQFDEAATEKIDAIYDECVVDPPPLTAESIECLEERGAGGRRRRRSAPRPRAAMPPSASRSATRTTPSASKSARCGTRSSTATPRW